MEFYKCASVYVPSKVDGFIVSGAGNSAVNGDYIDTGMTNEEDGTPIYKHVTEEFYYITMYGDKGICTSPTSHVVDGMYYYDQWEGKWYCYTVNGGVEPAPEVTAGKVTINADVPKTWDGYKAVWSDEDGYSFEETLTTGLAYSSGFTPSIGGIYSADAKIIASALYKKINGRSVLNLVSSRDSGINGTYKQVAGTEYGTKECRWQYMNSNYPTRNIHWGTPTVGGYYGDDSYVGVEGWHVFDGENENKVWLGNGAFPVAPTHWDANSTLTETVEDWD